MKKLSLLFVVLLLQLQFIFAQEKKSPSDDDVMKVLAIGNSFSEDALENYLHELATAAGKKIVIGNLYIGGAPLELHLNNAHNNLKAYSYRKIGEYGKKVTKDSTSLEDALADENWDYVSLQQASPLSGKLDVINESLTDLWTYVFAHVHSSTKLLYHQTWAYQQDSKHEGFKNYNNDQLTMYDSIMHVSKELEKIGDYAFIVPSGTAIQNFRTSSVGDKLTRDGYHLNLDYGRYAAALTWYGKLFNLDPRKASYKPEKVSDMEAKIAREAAHKAIRKPYKISKIRK